MKESKVHAPFVLDFILSYSSFPQEFSIARQVSRRWNKAATKGLTA